ncbi:hypothetical protein CUMW_085400 [Citrus unshiu]|nr:hypothetical protein CUMW_085400 [Citrus unshiu]GAY44897.1 hypothetical protein CUMW_085400 [Citrus unshiu]
MRDLTGSQTTLQTRDLQLKSWDHEVVPQRLATILCALGINCMYTSC